MKFSSWLEALKRGPSRRPIRRSESPDPGRKPAIGKLSVEGLEERTVPAFFNPVNYPASSYPTAVVSGYFNADGTMDLGATTNFSVFDGYYYGYGGGRYPHYHTEAAANVLLGNGDGSFGAPLTTALGYGGHTGAAAADLNGDGRADFVT